MIYISLGTNLGNRLENLVEAVRACMQGGMRLIEVSSVYESEAWGFQASTSFYNCVAVFESDKSPDEILSLTQEIELKLGRTAKTLAGYESRIIDLDLLFIDEKVINKANLKIPHEKMADRKFVLLPLNELNPLFIHPLQRISVNKLLQKCNDESEINLVVTNIDFAKKIARVDG